MPEITFYQQKRQDGGIRTGIDIDGDSAWQCFQPGELEPDPALLWYVDLRCEGSALPGDREIVREWLRQQAPVIKPAFMALAEKLRVGFDDEVWPYQMLLPQAPAGISMKIVCSAIRGLEPGTLGQALHDTGENWEDFLEQLSPAEAFT